jgi:hypothetical protein
MALKTCYFIFMYKSIRPTSTKPKNHQRFGRISSPTTPALKLHILKNDALSTPVKNISEFQEDLYDSSDEFLSCCDDISYSFPSPTKFVQVLVKGEGTQRKKQLHISPLNLLGEVHPLPNISMDEFPMLL